jgi:succinate dehydrogenase/fumarate reductase flavoprotein subunit
MSHAAAVTREFGSVRLSLAGTQPLTGAERRELDLVIVGSGAGGLTAALTAARAGLAALVIEKLPHFGGSSAMSGGALWIPGSGLARRAGIADSPAAVKEYLRSAAPAALSGERLDAFLEHGPRMLNFVARNSPVRFVLGRHVSDYHTDAVEARAVGRCVVAGSLDARSYGETLQRLALPLEATTVAGLPLERGRAVTHMFVGERSWVSLRNVGRMLWRASIDRWRFGRIARLTGGQALMTGLMHAALESRVEVWLSAAATRLTQDASGAVNGVEIETSAGTMRVTARVGVVLATGGFAHDAQLKSSLYEHVAAGAEHGTVAVKSASGDGIRMARAVGAELDHAPHGAAAWIPVSLVPGKEGARVYPHFSDRAKPGVIAIAPNGRRFVNEAASYHEFVRAMFDACRTDSGVHAWLVADARAFKRYGLGFARPAPWPHEASVRSGYLVRAASIDELAARIGVDCATLRSEVERFNGDALRGIDAAFGKGSTVYNRKMGDPAVAPNPCVAPLERAPFYAVRLIPGDLGTFTGLRTDANARVLREDGAPIRGLYAVGADMTNPLAGAYPGAGTTLGPIMTFGYLCGLHAAQANVRSAAD